jgi:Cys-rich repeat protein
MRANDAGFAFCLIALASTAGCGGSTAADDTTTLVCDPPCPKGQRCTTQGCVAINDAGPGMMGGNPDIAASACAPGCTASAPYCNAKGVCVPCMMDGHCPSGQVCRSVGNTSACVPGCNDDARCGGGGPDGGVPGAMKCCGGQCLDTSSDPNNCGGCGNACPVASSSALCLAGTCVPGKCHAGFGDCNLDPKDGCETNLHVDAANCTACGMKCAFPNATAGCSDGCYLRACNFGWDDCNGDPKDGCETSVVSDAKNCGGCGMVCPPVAHAKVTCQNGVCGLTVCDVGFADCDGNPKNGCEVAVGSDRNNCGKCGSACGQGQVCINGGCTCANCNIANATTKCVNNMCVFDQCVQGFADCDNNLANGCEVDTTTDANNCGKCGNACPMGMPACIASACSNAGKCSDVAQAYCKSKGWIVSPWQTAWPNQPGGAIFCVAQGKSAAFDCDTCQTYMELVWKNGAKDACSSGSVLVPGKAYGGHNPCACNAGNLYDCGQWPSMGCIPD